MYFAFIRHVEKTPEEIYYIFVQKECLLNFLILPAKPIIYFQQNNTLYQKGKQTKPGNLPTSNAFFGKKGRIGEEGISILCFRFQNAGAASCGSAHQLLYHFLINFLSIVIFQSKQRKCIGAFHSLNLHVV